MTMYVWYTPCCNQILQVVFLFGHSVQAIKPQPSLCLLQAWLSQGYPGTKAGHAWVNLGGWWVSTNATFSSFLAIWHQFISHCRSLTSYISFEECMGEGDICPMCLSYVFLFFYWRWIIVVIENLSKVRRCADTAKADPKYLSSLCFIWALSGKKTENTCAWIMGAW